MSKELTLKEKYFPNRKDEVVKISKKHEEGDIQKGCVEWFRLQYPKLSKLLFAVPNGGKRTARQGKMLKYEGMVAGVADLLLLVPKQGYGCLCLELKNGNKGRQQSNQKEWQEDAEKYGNKYVLVRSLDEFIKAVNEYLK
ncbi:MAG: VRR-NUC domain-containing protein [Bacteroidales bacterium]|nr:VRR-NUC domain-containing protein [Bacteroidales bacterium]MDD4685156.1 VRR-NUC domain-containing protein [Bacteroidales bacterium]